MNKSLFGKFRCKDTKNRYIYNNYARIKFYMTANTVSNAVFPSYYPERYM